MLVREGISDANLVEALWAVDIGLVGGRVCGGAGRVFGDGKGGRWREGMRKEAAQQRKERIVEDPQSMQDRSPNLS